jgi:hypothetical protein
MVAGSTCHRIDVPPGRYGDTSTRRLPSGPTRRLVDGGGLGRRRAGTRRPRGRRTPAITVAAARLIERDGVHRERGRRRDRHLRVGGSRKSGTCIEASCGHVSQERRSRRPGPTSATPAAGVSELVAEPTATRPTATTPRATMPTASTPSDTPPTAIAATATPPRVANRPRLTPPALTRPTATPPTATNPTAMPPTATTPRARPT